MRTRLLLLAAAAVALSGCVIHDHNNVPPAGVPGNVNVTWSFSDGTACGTNGVDHVRITIPGESLANGGVYPCTVAGTPGIQLQDFAAGSYSYSISAEDSVGRQLYGASGSFNVNGDVTVAALLQPLAAPGNVNFTWTFSDGNTCSQLGGFVDHIRISIPGEALDNAGIYPCELAGAQGIQLQNFAPGTYQFTITAETSGSVALYGVSGSFVVNGDVSVPVVLSPVNNAQPGNLIVYWSFPSNMTCATAGADHVVINIPGETLANGGVYPCQTNGVQGIILSNFDPRGYTVNVTAVDVNSNPLYAGSSNVSVNGDTTVNVALSATTNAAATLSLRWSFLDANQSPLTCAQAGITNVQVTLGNAPMQTVACNSAGVDGYDFPSLASGVYQVALTGLDSSGAPQFTYNQNIAVSAPTTVANVQLAPLSGSWDLAYNFSNAATCSIAGVTQVSLSVKDANGTEISGIASGTRYNCQDNPSNVFHWDSFPGGNVTIQMYGYGSSGTVLRGATRTTTVTAGAANSTTVTLDTCGTANAGC